MNLTLRDSRREDGACLCGAAGRLPRLREERRTGLLVGELNKARRRKRRKRRREPGRQPGYLVP